MGFHLFPKHVPILKRIMDLVLVIPGSVLLSPIILITLLIVWIQEGRPIFFKQLRPGLNRKIFTVYKFRTMRNSFDRKGKPLSDAERLTSLGKFLRATSLDELPELYNVLKGEMSVVGPRPLLIAYLDRYNNEQARRHEVLPGITGWAQINGRNTLSWQDKFKLDVWYVDNWSVWLDIRILFLTIWKVIKREGINQPGEATIQEFLGNE